MLETPETGFSMGSSSYTAIRVRSAGIRRRLTKNAGIEVSQNGVQAEFNHYHAGRVQFGTIHKIGMGLEGDFFATGVDERHVVALMNLVQVNYRVPWVERVWLGLGLEQDLRSHTRSFSDSKSESTGVESVRVMEHDIYVTENIIIKAGGLLLYASAYSAPFVQTPVYEIRHTRSSGKETERGLATRRKRDFSYRFGMAFDF